MAHRIGRSYPNVSLAFRSRWYSAVHKACWKCNTSTPHESVICSNKDCAIIQPVSPETNYFALFNVGKGASSSPTFDVDLKALKRQFLKLQQMAHPDSYAQASQQEHQYAASQSSAINKAYNTLRDPLARAHYLLNLQGQEISESESLHDPELLMDVMEFREELEEASSEEELAELKQRNDEKYKETVNKLSESFSKGALEEAKEYVIQLQYWENIRRAIIDWAPGKTIEIKH